jgi:hypothetical protein
MAAVPARQRAAIPANKILEWFRTAVSFHRQNTRKKYSGEGWVQEFLREKFVSFHEPRRRRVPHAPMCQVRERRVDSSVAADGEMIKRAQQRGGM